MAYPRYFAAGTRSIIMLPVAPLIFDHGVPTRLELFSVDRGRDLFLVKRLREERIPPSFHFHLLSKHWYKWNIRDIIDNSFFLLLFFFFEHVAVPALLINYWVIFQGTKVLAVRQASFVLSWKIFRIERVSIEMEMKRTNARVIKNLN